MGVERVMATRRAQIVWPMMTVTVTNFDGFTSNSENLQKCAQNQDCCLVKRSKFVTVTVIIGHTI